MTYFSTQYSRSDPYFDLCTCHGLIHWADWASFPVYWWHHHFHFSLTFPCIFVFPPNLIMSSSMRTALTMAMRANMPHPESVKVLKHGLLLSSLSSDPWNHYENELQAVLEADGPPGVQMSHPRPGHFRRGSSWNIDQLTAISSYSNQQNNPVDPQT